MQCKSELVLCHTLLPVPYNLGTEQCTFLSFQYIACDLSNLNADDYTNSDNLVARLNLPLMCYNEDRKVEIYSHAVDGLISLEPRKDFRLKYIEFIDQYANLSASELDRYQTEYVVRSQSRNEVMGLLQHTHNKGRQEGEAITLRHLMKKKFGGVPKDAEELIEKANSETLLEWSENVLSAETIEEVFH